MTNDEELIKAKQAKQLLADPLFIEAFDKTRELYLSEWENSPARDSEGREKIWLMLKTLEVVKGHIQTVLDGGKIALHQMEAKTAAKPANRKKSKIQGKR